MYFRVFFIYFFVVVSVQTKHEGGSGDTTSTCSCDVSIYIYIYIYIIYIYIYNIYIYIYISSSSSLSSSSFIYIILNNTTDNLFPIWDYTNLLTFGIHSTLQLLDGNDQVDDCCCTVNDARSLQARVGPLANLLSQTIFFRFYKAQLNTFLILWSFCLFGYNYNYFYIHQPKLTVARPFTCTYIWKTQVNLVKKCPLWPSTGQCAQKSCAVAPCLEVCRVCRERRVRVWSRVICYLLWARAP